MTLNRSDFEKLFIHHFDELVRYVKGYVIDTDLAKDIVHDVYVIIWQRRNHLDISFTLKSYLYTLCRHQALNYIRHQRVIFNNTVSLEEHIMISAERVDEEIYQKRLSFINEKFLKLPRKQQEIVYKYFIEGKAFKQTAIELDVSVSTVKTQIYRAIKAVQDQIHQGLLFLLFKKWYN